MRTTLEKVEQGSHLDPHDPAVAELRRTILSRIADLQFPEQEPTVKPVAVGTHNSEIKPALDPSPYRAAASADVVTLIVKTRANPRIAAKDKTEPDKRDQP